MKKLANISNFEMLQLHANRTNGTASEMTVFNAGNDGDPLYSDEVHDLDEEFEGVQQEEDEDDYDDDDWEEEDEGLGERMPEFDRKKQKELEDKWDCHSYLDMMKKSNCVLANFVEDRVWNNYGDTVELVSGRLDPGEEVFQWFIVEDPWFIQHHTYEPLFYDDEWDIYILGVTNYGTHRSMVSAPQLR